MFRRMLARSFRILALAMMATAALLGIPFVIDPPPRDRVEEGQPLEGRSARPKRRGRRPS